MTRNPQEISEAIRELQALQEKYGYNAGMVMFLMNVDYDTLQRLGGVDDNE